MYVAVRFVILLVLMQRAEAAWLAVHLHGAREIRVDEVRILAAVDVGHVGPRFWPMGRESTKRRRRARFVHEKVISVHRDVRNREVLALHRVGMTLIDDNLLRDRRLVSRAHRHWRLGDSVVAGPLDSPRRRGCEHGCVAERDEDEDVGKERNRFI